MGVAKRCVLIHAIKHTVHSKLVSNCMYRLIGGSLSRNGWGATGGGSGGDTPVTIPLGKVLNRTFKPEKNDSKIDDP